MSLFLINLIILTIMQYCFALFLGNSAVLFAKRNGIPLMALTIITFLVVSPFKYLIVYGCELGYVVNSRTVTLSICFLFLGWIGIEAYYSFLRKKIGGTNLIDLKEILKPCRTWFLIVMAIPIIVLDYLGFDWINLSMSIFYY